MRQDRLLQIRYYPATASACSLQVGRKPLPRPRALKVMRRLRASGVDVFALPVTQGNQK